MQKQTQRKVIMRYTKQYHKKTCVPTAVINLLKWQERKASYKKDIHRISKICKCSKTGVSGNYIAHILKRIFKNTFVKTLWVPTIDEINNELSKDRAVVLSCNNTESIGGRHCSICIGQTPKFYFVVNGITGSEAVRKISKNTVKRILKRKFYYNKDKKTKNSCSSTMYVIKKSK